MTNSLLYIDNTDVSEGLTKYEIEDYDLHSEDSGTAIDGTEYVTIIRPNKIKLSLGWENITTAEMRFIINSINQGTNIPVRYISFVSDDNFSSISACYRGDRSYSLVVNNGTDRLWNLSFSLIEM